MLFISFSPLVGLVWTSSTTLNRNGESRHYFLFSLWVRVGGVFNILTLSMMLAVRLLQIPFIKLGKFFSIPSSLRNFIVKECWFLNQLRRPYEFSHLFFLCVELHLLIFQMLSNLEILQ